MTHHWEKTFSWGKQKLKGKALRAVRTDPEGYIEEVLSKQALFLAMQSVARLLLTLPQLVSNMFLTSNSG